jgi:hypothetical protein
MLTTLHSGSMFGCIRVMLCHSVTMSRKSCADICLPVTEYSVTAYDITSFITEYKKLYPEYNTIELMLYVIITMLIHISSMFAVFVS